jgi:uncharacterized membrane protein
MGDLVSVVALAGMLGSGLIGGVFFAFSNFVMPALVRSPPAEGVAAMQTINVTVLNRGFLGVFLGTAVLSAGAIGLGVMAGGVSGWACVLGGALYGLGTFAVTGVRNVPLNNALVHVEPQADDAPAAWSDYARRWTFWNHVRTVAALLAALAFGVA